MGDSTDIPIIDFTQGRLGYRFHPKRAQHELLAKAIGRKINYYPNVIDVTAGLGQDAFLLASLGCHVLCLEREPMVAKVFAAALSHAHQDPRLTTISNRIKLLITEAKDYLANLTISERPDVIYCDPMFSPRTKTAKVKKPMQWLQNTVPISDDAATLATLALQIAKRRVVIKRAKHATYLIDNPTFSLYGKPCRFDVYCLSCENTRNQYFDE